MPGQRKWVKLWVTESLNGSIRYQLTPDQRSVWYDMILFAALGEPPGRICDRDGRKFPHEFIANRLNVPLSLFEETLSACNDEGRTREDERGIEIVNWPKYQSEYDRQKQYRSKVEDNDPDKYIHQKYGDSVIRTSEDLKRIEDERKRRSEGRKDGEATPR